MTITIEKIEYIVGIDFGHGETAAWVVSVEETGTKKDEGYALLLKRSNEVRQRAIPSEVYFKDGVYGIDNKVGSSIITQMKMKTSELKKKNKFEPYKKYIRCVVERLLDLNRDILNKEKRNFILCMASPTSWNESEKKEYLNFFNEAIADLGLRFEWIINESDAAFFSRKHKSLNDKSSTLVIDYGSSTIDYTLMEDGRKVSAQEWSNDQLGAHCIEECMINAARDPENKGYDPNYEQTLANTNKYFRKTCSPDVKAEEWIKHECRKVKENYYTNYSEKGGTDFFEDDGEDEDNERFDVFVNYNCAIDVTSRRNKETMPLVFNWAVLMDKITEEYRNKVREKFREVLIKNGNKKPDSIILSGGASIMYWVKSLVKEVFGDIKIIEDREPSFVVAEGIALYARAQYKAIDVLVKEIESEDYASMYKKADAKANHQAIVQLSPLEVQKIAMSAPITGEQIRSSFCNFIEKINPENITYCQLAQKNFNEAINEFVFNAIKSAVRNSFGITIENESFKEKISIPISVLPWKHDMFKPGGSWYDNITSVMDNIYTFNFNMNKSRDCLEAKKVANKIKDMLCGYDFLKYTIYPMESVNSFANQIKEIAVKEAIRIFYEKQLFTTTFSA